MSKTAAPSKEVKRKALQAWKQAYTKSLIDALEPKGAVLEVGFGKGDAAGYIQTFTPSSHTIIEIDPVIASHAKEWSSTQKNVTVIQESWQNALSKLGRFDAVFFNDYPPENEAELIKFDSPEEIKEATDRAVETIQFLQQEISKEKIQYSDKEIEDFYNQIGKHNSNELPDFFKKLCERGNISEKQYTAALKKYVLNASANQSTRHSYPMLEFLEKCIASHMKKGARFTCFLHTANSKYEDSPFFESIITNPEIDFHEEVIPIAVKDFKPVDSLIIMVTLPMDSPKAKRESK